VSNNNTRTLLDRNEVAQRAKRHVNSVDNWQRRGILPEPFRAADGRLFGWLPEEIDAFIAKWVKE